MQSGTIYESPSAFCRSAVCGRGVIRPSRICNSDRQDQSGKHLRHLAERESCNATRSLVLKVNSAGTASETMHCERLNGSDRRTERFCATVGCVSAHTKIVLVLLSRINGARASRKLDSAHAVTYGNYDSLFLEPARSQWTDAYEGDDLRTESETGETELEAKQLIALADASLLPPKGHESEQDRTQASQVRW